MPYLAIGSVLRVRNDCTGTDCLLPVTGCATIARLFNDRCVTCGTSPRGRIADLTHGQLRRAWRRTRTWLLQRHHHDWRVTVLDAIREVQIPLLAAHAARRLRHQARCGRCGPARSTTGLGPTALFPMHLRRPLAIDMCAIEGGLGLGLILTAGRIGAGPAATCVRLGAVLLFLVATSALIELRPDPARSRLRLLRRLQHRPGQRPDAGQIRSAGRRGAADSRPAARFRRRDLREPRSSCSRSCAPS